MQCCKMLLPMWLAFAFWPATLSAQLASGPAEGSKLQPLKVVAATGDDAGQEVDAAKGREGKPTVFVFVQHKTWDRPVARFLRTLDDELVQRNDGTRAVAVWLTDDVDAAKEYLPRAQQSLDLKATDWTVHPGDTSGPAEWGINADAHVTAVIARDQQVTASLAWRSLNETDVPAVLEKLKGKE